MNEQQNIADYILIHRIDESEDPRTTSTKLSTHIQDIENILDFSQHLSRHHEKDDQLLHVWLSQMLSTIEDALISVMIEKYPSALEHRHDLPLHLDSCTHCRSSIISLCIELYPGVLSRADEDGYLPLHRVLRNGSSCIDDALIIIEKYPAALHHHSHDGFLPLHSECMNQGRSSIISKCIELYPEALGTADRQGLLPLHTLLSNELSSEEDALMLIEKYPAALQHHNDGLLPIHLECARRCRSSIISKCIELYPGGLAMAYRQVYLPLHYLLDNKSSSIDLALLVIENHPAALSHPDRDGRCPLHVECWNRCRSDIISKCIELYPEALAIPDRYGNMPLHRLLWNKASTIDDVMMVLANYPAALEHSNRDGICPLHIALTCLLYRPVIISKCIELYPQALATADKMTYIGLKRYVQEAFLSDELLSTIETHIFTLSPCIDYLQKNNDTSELLVEIREECVKRRRSLQFFNKLAAVKLDPASKNIELKASCPLHKLLEEPSTVADVLMMIEKYPETLQERNEQGELPLHVECKISSRSSIIWKCVELYPKALSVVEMRGNLPLHRLLGNTKSSVHDALVMIEKYPAALKVQNGYGNLPLHLECKFSHRPSIISKCIELYPESLTVAENKGSLPLHGLLTNKISSIEDALIMIEKYPAALQHQNVLGELPLHLECKNLCRSIIIWQFIELFPEALEIADIDGNMPLHWLLWNESSTISDVHNMIEEYPAALQHKNNVGHLPLLIERRCLCRLAIILKCIELYPDSLDYAYQSGYLPLHSLLVDKLSSSDHALTMIEKYPPVLAFKDNQGQLPLHIESSNQCRPSIISKIIKLNLEALKEPDSDGCLPLHLLLWNDKSSIEVALMMIMKYPPALTSKDKSGYLPIHVECHSQCRVVVIRTFVRLNSIVLGSKDSRFKTPLAIVLDRIRQAGNESEIYDCLPAITYLATVTDENSCANLVLEVAPCRRGCNRLTENLKRRILLNLVPDDKIADSKQRREKQDLNWQPRSSMMMLLLKSVDVRISLKML
jgi:ankyrin repeat protein